MQSLDRLRDHPQPLAQITEIVLAEIALQNWSDFEIRASLAEDDAFVLAEVDKDAVAFCYEIA